MNKKKIIIIILVILALILIFNSITIVKTGYVGVRTRFGAVTKSTISEGLNLKVPFIEKIVTIDCRTKKTTSTSEASTKDLQTVNSTVAVNYNVVKETANTLYQTIGKNYIEVIVEPAILESIKSVMAQYTAEELITKRSEVSLKIQETLSSKISNNGFLITSFNITDLQFSEAYNKAIEEKAVAQQNVEKSKAELEKQQIENNKEISIAEKDAKVMELRNQQITDKTLALKELEVQEKFIEKWSGNLPNTMLNDSMSTLFNLN